MKKIKLNIVTSPNKNMTYQIFRSINQEDLPNDLSTLMYLTPIFTIDESLAPKTITETTEEIILDVSYIDTENMIKYTMNHVPTKDDKHGLTVNINFNNPESIIQYERVSIAFTFDTFGVIKNIIVTNKDKTTMTYIDQLEIDKIIKIDNKQLYINDGMLLNNYSVTCDYNVEVITVEDYASSPILGITYNGGNAHGLNKPSIISTECLYDDGHLFRIPYLRLIPDNTYHGLIYYYIIVGIDTLLNISNPSPLIAINLEQDASTILYTLQVSKNYTTDSANCSWETISTSIKINDMIEVGKPNTDTYLSYGSIVTETVPIFLTKDISFNQNYVDSDNKIVLNFPNVWYENNPIYNLRTGKAYRVMSNIGTNYSEVSDVINATDSKNIPVEKLVVIKRNASNDFDAVAPSTIGQNGTEIIKTYIRKGGIYYNSTDYDNEPYDVPSADSDVIVMSTMSVFDTFTIESVSCVPGQKYNFTFYIFDSYGNQSIATSTLITL